MMRWRPLNRGWCSSSFFSFLTLFAHGTAALLPGDVKVKATCFEVRQVIRLLVRTLGVHSASIRTPRTSACAVSSITTLHRRILVIISLKITYPFPSCRWTGKKNGQPRVTEPLLNAKIVRSNPNASSVAMTLYPRATANQGQPHVVTTPSGWACGHDSVLVSELCTRGAPKSHDVQRSVRGAKNGQS